MTDWKHIGLAIDISEGPLFLISDVHAGALSQAEDDFAKRQFENLTTIVAESKGRLIILGDLFDYWQESGSRTPKPLNDWLIHLHVLNKFPKKTILITGNHDHWAGAALAKYGFDIVRDHAMVTTPNGTWLLIHGDGLPNADLSLSRKGLNRHFRNPAFNTLFNLLPLAIRVSIMRAFSSYRKQRGIDKNEHAQTQLHLSKWLENHDFAGIVYGHTHIKGIRNLYDKYLVNAGTFFSDASVVLLSGTAPKLTTVDELKSMNLAK